MISAYGPVFKLNGGSLGFKKFTLYKGNVNTPVDGDDGGNLDNVTISLEFIKLRK